eukprot:m51a1_g2480 hypothetical protein (297) ;mRNA; f:71588-72684
MAQATDYFCCDAALAMALARWSGRALDQHAVADVCRAWPDGVGTATDDIVRGAHFSRASSAPSGSPFPDVSPKGGWSPAQPLGMGAFPCFAGTRENRSDEGLCWIEALKDALAAGAPVVVDMGFTDDLADMHCNVAVAYDDAAGTVTLLDPWNRAEGNGVRPPTVTYTQEHFCRLWSASDFLRGGRGTGEMKKAFFGMPVVPWTVSVSFWPDALRRDALWINATVEYTHPALGSSVPSGIACPSYEAHDPVVEITLPRGSLVLDGSEQRAVVPLGKQLGPGQRASASWMTPKRCRF